MGRTIEKIEGLERKIRRFQEAPDTGLDVEDLALDFGDLDEDEDVEEAHRVGGGSRYLLQHLHLDDWLKDLKKDKDQLRTPI